VGTSGRRFAVVVTMLALLAVTQASARADTSSRVCLPVLARNARLGPTKIAFVVERTDNDDIWAINTDGTNRVRLTDTEGRESTPAWSPDGTKIAYQYYHGENHDIYVIDSNGANVKRLTDNPKPDVRPRWSPDGTKILFNSQRDHEHCITEIYVMDADGSNQTRLTDNYYDDIGGSWSPDGQRILFMSTRREGGAKYDLYVMNADGSDQRCLTEGLVGDCLDGDWLDDNTIGFSVHHEEFWPLSNTWVMNADGSGRISISNYSYPFGAVGPEWSPDRTRITYGLIQHLGGIRYQSLGLHVMNADGTNKTSLGDMAEGCGPAEKRTGGWWSRDGTKIFYMTGWDLYWMNPDGSGQTRLFPLMEDDSEIEEIEDIVWQP